MTGMTAMTGMAGVTHCHYKREDTCFRTGRPAWRVRLATRPHRAILDATLHLQHAFAVVYCLYRSCILLVIG